MQEVFKWVDQYGNTIFSQLRRIGSSLDWSRQVLLLHTQIPHSLIAHNSLLRTMLTMLDYAEGAMQIP